MKPAVRQLLMGGKKNTPWKVLSEAKNRRIDVVMVGDSNTLQGGFGWDHGMNYALALKGFKEYATAIYTPQGYGSQGATSSTGSIGAASGAPGDQEALWPTGTVQNYGYYTNVQTYSGSSGRLLLTTASPLGVNNALTLWYAYATFSTDAGSFRTGIRRGSSPFNHLANGTAINTNTGAASFVLSSVSIAAATRDFSIEGGWNLPTVSGGTDITGPFIGYYLRFEAPATTAGYSVHTLVYRPGESLYSMANILQTESNVKMVRYWTEVRRLQLSQGLTPKVVVWINSGLNDRNETSQPSLGPGAYTDADSPEAFVDNAVAIKQKIESIWTSQGWDITGLYWVICPSHVIAADEDADLKAYRAAAKGWAASQPRTDVVDMIDYMSYAETLANSWYNTGPDPQHLTQAGYENLMWRVINAKVQ